MTAQPDPASDPALAPPNPTGADIPAAPAGAGRPATARTRLWKDAAAELVPARSLARVDERARQVIGNVSLVGSVLTGLGLIAADKLNQTGPARALTIVAVCLALAAVATALGSALLHVTPSLTPGNLIEVERWYRTQFRRAYPVVAAGVLLIAAVITAAIAAVIVITTRTTAQPMIAVQWTGVGDDTTLTSSATFPDVAPGAVLTTEVTATTPSGARVTLARGVTLAGDNGTATTTIQVPHAGEYSTVEFHASVANHTCTATLGPGPPVLRCITP